MLVVIFMWVDTFVQNSSVFFLLVLILLKFSVFGKLKCCHASSSCMSELAAMLLPFFTSWLQVHSVQRLHPLLVKMRIVTFPVTWPQISGVKGLKRHRSTVCLCACLSLRTRGLRVSVFGLVGSVCPLLVVAGTTFFCFSLTDDTHKVPVLVKVRKTQVF